MSEDPKIVAEATVLGVMLSLGLFGAGLYWLIANPTG
jgi:hypothetical protein